MENDQYHAEYLGVVGESHYKLLGSFFAQDGLARVRTRLPYISEGSFYSQTQLEALEKYIAQDGLLEKFIRGLGSIKQLQELQRTQWGYLQGAANEILCEEHVRMKEMLSGQALVSGRALAEAIRGYCTNSQVSIEENSLTFHHGSRYTTCPDALLLLIDDDERKAKLEKVYEFKSRMDGSDTQGLYRDAKINEVKQIFKPDSLSCRVLTDAISQVIGIPAENITVPDPSHLPIRLISSETGIITDNPDYLRVRFNGGVKCFEFPSIRRCSYFVLKILTGEVTEQKQWEDYFTQVDSRTADTLRVTQLNQTPHRRKPRREPAFVGLRAH